MFKDKRLAFIGTGIMGEAMISGMIERDIVQPEQVIGSNTLHDRNDYLQQTYRIETTNDNRQAVEGADIVVLSVKPQIFNYVAHDLHGHIEKDALVLSIIAGTTISQLASGLLHGAVVRSMPNTPAQIGMGITVWTATEAVTDAQREQARAIFGSLGREVEVDDESYLDMATALSGSGPAYIFLLMEAMIDAGVHMGFSRRVASDLVFQTIIGSVEYAERTGKHVAELRNQVTSPGGTTAEALYHMEKGGFRTVISRGIWAAYERSRSLGRGEKIHDPRES